MAEELKGRKAANPRRFEYGVMLSLKHAGLLTLMALPGKTVRHEYIGITPGALPPRCVAVYGRESSFISGATGDGRLRILTRRLGERG